MIGEEARKASLRQSWTGSQGPEEGQAVLWERGCSLRMHGVCGSTRPPGDHVLPHVCGIVVVGALWRMQSPDDCPLEPKALEGSEQGQVRQTPSDAESSASLCTSAELNLGDRVLGEVEKDSFLTLPGKGALSKPMPSKPSVPTWETIVRSFTVIVQRGHGQLVDILLIGWCGGERESASSTFWFQLVWDLHVCGQHTIVNC